MTCPYESKDNISVQTTKPLLRRDPLVGSKIFIYGQVFVWTDKHLTPSDLKPWRKYGDYIIDEFYQLNGDHLENGDDTYELIQDFSVNNNSTKSEKVSFGEYIRRKPSWFDVTLAKDGQEFFLKNMSMILVTIFHYTLIIGYGFQQLNDVINRTNYLSSDDLHQTYRRLIETLQMISRVMCGELNEFDETFSDVVRVRLLHGMVRYKIDRHKRNSNEDVSINQEDLLVTLLGFSFVVLSCIEDKIGIELSEHDKKSYLHIWRYIGWLSGIEEDYLEYLSSYDQAKILSESIAYHFYSPTNISRHLVHHSLMATYQHGLIPFSYKFIVGMSQVLIGDKFSQILGIDEPKIDRLHCVSIRLMFSMFRLIYRLGRLNIKRVNQWIIKRNKQRLCFMILSNLDNELVNFSIYRKDRRILSSNEKFSLKNCSCQYYRKKSGEKIETFDFGTIRMKSSKSFDEFFREILFLLFSLIFVYFLTTICLTKEK